MKKTNQNQLREKIKEKMAHHVFYELKEEINSGNIKKVIVDIENKAIDAILQAVREEVERMRINGSDPKALRYEEYNEIENVILRVGYYKALDDLLERLGEE